MENTLSKFLKKAQYMARIPKTIKAEAKKEYEDKPPG